MKSLREINHSPVSDHLEIEFTGQHRSIQLTQTRTVAALLEEAENAEGVYGPDNQPVSAEMTVLDLLRWHCDYEWTLTA